MLRLILASASPRRRQLLALGWPFDVQPAHADETPLPDETPAQLVVRLSELKARQAAQGVEGAALVIGADTTVALDGRILGKPLDAAEARAMLAQLRARPHEVFTGLTVLDTRTGQAHTDLARSSVPMRDYTDAELEAYVASGDPLDKAGAYAIQHAEFQPVALDRFNECFANVMGLPLCHLLRRLQQLGLAPTQTPEVPAACQRFIPYACPVSTAILEARA